VGGKKFKVEMAITYYSQRKPIQKRKKQSGFIDNLIEKGEKQQN